MCTFVTATAAAQSQEWAKFSRQTKMTNLPSLSLQAVSLHHVSPSRDLKWMLIFSLEKCTILHVLSTSHLSHPSLLIPVYSQLCNVTIFVKQHLKNFPCVIKTTEKTLNYCMCSYLAIACQPRNIHSHETRQSEGEKTTGWCQWQMGWRSWIFFFQGTVSSVSSCKSVPSSIGASVLGGWGNLSLLQVARTVHSTVHSERVRRRHSDKTNVVFHTHKYYYRHMSALFT